MTSPAEVRDQCTVILKDLEGADVVEGMSTRTVGRRLRCSTATASARLKALEAAGRVESIRRPGRRDLNWKLR